MDETMRTATMDAPSPRAPRFGMGVTMRRSLAFHAVAYLVAMAWFLVQCLRRVMALMSWEGGLPGTVQGESLAGFVFAAALLWQVLCFGTAICHGVSRRSFFKASAAGATALAAAVSLTLVVLRAARRFGVGCVPFPKPGASGCIYQEPFSLWFAERFRYWSVTKTISGNGAYRGTASQVNDALSDWGGVASMMAAMFALMLLAAALGMLLGAALAWAASQGVAGVAVVLVCVLLVLGARGFCEGMVSEMGLWNEWNWLTQLLQGLLVTVPRRGTTVTLSIVWIPLGISLVLSSACAALTSWFTSRREVRPLRHPLA